MLTFSNDSGVPAGWTMGFERDGREKLIVVAKATYELPAPGGAAAPVQAAVQVPLVEADEFNAEPGCSAPRYETDYAHCKPGCDVLLLGSAHAPGGRPTARVTVGLQLGPMAKLFAVVGERRWRKRLLGVDRSAAQPFVRLPLSYDCAFGGTDRTQEAAGGSVAAYDANPVGQGFRKHLDGIDGQPLPHTEELGREVDKPGGDYAPMAFSPVGRGWLPRRRHAGTYDEAWAQSRAPFWPDDFDERYFQAAPPDQVIPWPTGGEQVVLLNLTPDGRRAFRLPSRRMPVLFVPYQGRDVQREARLDTIVIEPDLNRMTLTWRATLALGRSVFDVKEIIVGDKPAAWHRARRFPGKTYYASLADVVAARRRTGRL